MPNEQPLELKASPELKIDMDARQAEVGQTPVPMPDELLYSLNMIGTDLRALIVQTKRLKRVPGLDPHQDPTRALAVAQQYLQTGMMWMRRAIEQKSEF